MSFNRLITLVLFLFSSAIVTTVTNVSAQSLPLWELGVAVGHASIPHYRGSASNRDITLPMPLAIYRGTKKANIRAKKPVKTNQRRFALAPSFAIGLPVPQGQEFGVRRNMPALDATLEYGPKLSVNLWKKQRQLIGLHLPLRAVSSISSRHFEMQGWVIAPYLNYIAEYGGKNSWQLNVAFGPQYGSSGFHEYYYGVSKEYSLIGREEYIASRGYSGSRITTYIQKSFNRLWLSVFARYDNLSRTSFVNSPLIERKNSLFAGFVVGWVFTKSPRQVYVSK